MKGIKKMLARFFRCKKGINRLVLKWKRSWDEVSAILNDACCGEKKKKRKRHKKL